MKIQLTKFALRHFNEKYVGTKILDMIPSEFEKRVNVECGLKTAKILDGYADFCKLVFIPNFTDAKIGTIPIIIENYQYIRSGYSKRREGELPVLNRWIELPIEPPRAKWLVLVLYSKEQLKLESMHQKEDQESFENADYGIVAILAQNSKEEEPMTPATMLRNSLGKEEGGSGVALDKKKYNKSVEFWSKNIIIK